MGKGHKGQIWNGIKIVDIAKGGKGIGRHENRVIFVDDAIPEDHVNVEVLGKYKGSYRGKIIEYVERSPYQAEAFCQHFTLCGGCRWQHMMYEQQAQFKANNVIQTLRRIGEVDEATTVLPTLACEQERGYRNKLEFSFSSKRWLTRAEIESGKQIDNKGALGFHAKGSYDKIVQIEKCHLMPDLANQIRNETNTFCRNNQLTFYDFANHDGDMRNMFLRCTTSNEWMLVMSFGKPMSRKKEELLEHLKATFPQLTSIQYVINQKKNDTIQDLDVELFHGNSHIEELMGEMKFRISAKSFFQTNTLQAKKLYDVVLGFIGSEEHGVIYDLYCGTGSISCFLAAHGKKVIGIEQVEAAIQDAKINAELNGLSNLTFFEGTVRSILDPKFVEKHGRPTVIVTDPPRAGMHPNAVEALLEIRTPRIVYVSCNASSQARDIKKLNSAYRVVKFQPVDLFPQTDHMENVALLELL